MTEVAGIVDGRYLEDSLGTVIATSARWATGVERSTIANSGTPRYTASNESWFTASVVFQMLNVITRSLAPS